MSAPTKLLVLALFVTSCTPVPALAAKPVVNPFVNQGNIWQTICLPGYTRQIRPPVSYTNPIKKALLEREGLTWDAAADYQLDHVTPLTLGGHPTSRDNLKLHSYHGEYNVRRKDRLAVNLKHRVCRGEMPLRQAREEMATDWVAAYAKYVK